MKATHRRSTRAARARGLTAIGLAAAVAAGLSIVGIQTAGASPSTNLVRNSGFEHGLTGWRSPYKTSTLTLAPSGHSGSHAARLTAKTSGARFVLDDVPSVVSSTKRGRTYAVGVWVRTSASSSVTLRVREWKSGAVVGRGASTVTVSSAWKHITLSYVAKSSAGKIAVNVIIPHAQAHQWLDSDTVAVRLAAPAETSSPAPGSGGAAGDTVFGATMWMNSGESWNDTYNRLSREYGHLDMIRAFCTGMPAAWSSSLLSVGGGSINVSFKAPPKAILSGSHDAELKKWFASAPTNRTIWWTYYHEPEDNIANGEFTAADYRAAWKRIVGIANSAGPSNLKATLVLMDWSLSPKSGRNWKDYYAGSSYIDVLGWDSYNSHRANPTRYFSGDENFGLAVQVSKAEGKPFGFSEWGSQLIPGDKGAGRAAWMKGTARYMTSVGAEFGAYFDAPVGNEYRLFDQPGQTALRDIMNGSY
jgi:Carbohydrate binding domain